MVSLLLVVMAVGFAVYLAVARLSRPSEHARRVQEVPTVAIADAADAAHVRIEGTVEALGDLVEAPLSGVECVYYELLVRPRAGLGALHGQIVATGAPREEVGGVMFAVRDATGRAVVDPEGATALLAVDERREEQAGASPVTAVMGIGGTFELIERRIEPGDPLIVVGVAVREPDPDPGAATADYRTGPAMRLRLGASTDVPLHLADAQ